MAKQSPQTDNSYPEDLPGRIVIRFKEKGKLDIARTLCEIKKRKRLETFAKTVELVIIEYNDKDKVAFELRQQAEYERNRANRYLEQLTNLKASLDALRTLR